MLLQPKRGHCMCHISARAPGRKVCRASPLGSAAPGHNVGVELLRGKKQPRERQLRASSTARHVVYARANTCKAFVRFSTLDQPVVLALNAAARAAARGVVKTGVRC